MTTNLSSSNARPLISITQVSVKRDEFYLTCEILTFFFKSAVLTRDSEDEVSSVAERDYFMRNKAVLLHRKFADFSPASPRARKSAIEQEV